MPRKPLPIQIKISIPHAGEFLYALPYESATFGEDAEDADALRECVRDQALDRIKVTLLKGEAKRVQNVLNGKSRKKR